MSTIPRPSLIPFVRNRQQRATSERSYIVPTAPNIPASNNTSSNQSPDDQLDAVAQIQKGGLAPDMSSGNHPPSTNTAGQQEDIPVSAIVTIPKDAAVTYLKRTLAEVKKFKQDLAFRSALETKYPPFAVLYGKSLPTVDGCRVRGRDGIKRADAYDDLTFGSGDGVVLAKAAQLPTGYRVAKGGVVSTDRGHMGLLGDLEAVARCLNAILAERKRRSLKRNQPAAADGNGDTVDINLRDSGQDAVGIEGASTVKITESNAANSVENTATPAP